MQVSIVYILGENKINFTNDLMPREMIAQWESS